MSKKIKFLLWFIIFIAGSSELCFVGTIQNMAIDFTQSITLMGQQVTVYSVSFALIGPIMIKVTRKYKYKLVFLYSILIFLTGNVLTLTSSTFLVLLLSRMITAVSSSVLIAKSFGLVTILSHPKHLSKELGYLYTAFAGANTFAIPTYAYIGTKFSWRIIPMVYILIAGFFLFCSMMYLPKFETEEIETNSNPQRKEKFKLRISTLTILLTTICILSSNMVFMGYITPFMLNFGFSEKIISIALLIFGIGGIIGSYCSPKLTKRLSIKFSLLLLLMFYSFFLLMVYFTASKFLFLSFVLLWSISQWGTGPLLQRKLMNESVSHQEFLASLNVSAINIGAALGSGLGGVFLQRYSITSLPLQACIIGTIAFIVVLSYKKED